MKSIKFAICIAAALTPACKIHGIPEIPPENDPAAEQAPIVPYRAPPDVLTKELSTGAPASGAMPGHEGHTTTRSHGADGPEGSAAQPKRETAGTHRGHGDGGQR